MKEFIVFGFVTASMAAAGGELFDLEQRAQAAFLRNDCPAAVEDYQSALKLDPPPASAALYYRRIGICRNRHDEFEAALVSYRAGIEAARIAKDRELEAENVHGAGIAVPIRCTGQPHMS